MFDERDLFIHSYRNLRFITLGFVLVMLLVGLISLIRVPDSNTYPSKLLNRNLRKICHSMSRDSLLEVQSVRMLDRNQRKRLEMIMEGKINRSEIEIVISRFKEDITWSNMYSGIRTIYDKSGNPDSLPAAPCQPGKVESLPNFGRETHTYLHHIVKNYDKLAKVTVFTQGSAPTRGYQGHRIGGGHLMANSTFHDFVLNPNGHFVFSSVMWLPTIAHYVRLGYNAGKLTRYQAVKRCPTVPINAAGGAEARFSFEVTPVLYHVAKLCEQEQNDFCSGPKFWHKFIKLPEPPHGVVFFTQGALFSATAEQIRRRPLDDYKYLLDFASKSNDTSIGFFMEWFWYYLVTSEVAPCNINGEEFTWALNLPIYESFDFPRRKKFVEEKKKKSKKSAHEEGGDPVLMVAMRERINEQLVLRAQ